LAAIADRLARLLLDRDLAARMGAAGRARVEERWRWDTQAECLTSLLRP
jgi:phosphatidylinositol alpha-1,6-mannosyltransferase